MTRPVKLIKKANNLVEGKYRFNIWEMRIFTKMLTMIDKDDADFQEYRIYLKDIITYFGLKNDHSAYQWLKDASIQLMKKIIMIKRETDEGPKEFRTPIVAGVETDENTNYKYVDLSFHPKMKPYLLELKNKYLLYDARNILHMSSVYSIRLYEILKQYERIGSRKVELEALKWMIGVNSMETDEKGKEVEVYRLKSYGHFKSRVLIPAQKDFSEKCDISFDFYEIKKGRKVDAIQFKISLNEKIANGIKRKKRRTSSDKVNQITDAHHKRTRAILYSNADLEARLRQQMGSEFNNTYKLTIKVMGLYPDKYRKLS